MSSSRRAGPRTDTLARAAFNSASAAPVRAVDDGRRLAGGRRARGRRAAPQRRPAGVRLVPRDAWAGRAGLRAAADVNAVPPLGVEGIEATDNGVERDGVTVFGALGVGSLKMKIHKACIARLFEQNDLVLDAETIVEVARTLSLGSADRPEPPTEG